MALEGTQELSWHNSFWNCLLLWLAEQNKSNCNRKHGIASRCGRSMPPGNFVMGSDFSPAADSSPKAYITARTDSCTNRPASLTATGQDSTVPTFCRSCLVNTISAGKSSCPKQNLSRESLLLARQSGKEMQNTEYHEETLRDIARISGGKFFTSKDFLSGRLRYPCQSSCRKDKSSKPLASSWTLLLSICAVFTLQWALRRHHGLK